METPEKIDAWMFRVPNEFVTLIFSLILVLLLGFVFYSLNLYVFLGLLIIGVIYINILQAQLLGNAIRVHEQQFPKIYNVFKNFAIKLNTPRVALYIKQDPVPNAFTIGFTTSSIVLTSGLVEQFSEEELGFVIGHELGHVKTRHNVILSLIHPAGSNLFLSSFLFSFWSRNAEYSADRCALILTKNMDSAITSLLKLAIGGKLFRELNIHGYVAQITKAASTGIKFKLAETLVDHPLITNNYK